MSSDNYYRRLFNLGEKLKSGEALARILKSEEAHMAVESAGDCFMALMMLTGREGEWGMLPRELIRASLESFSDESSLIAFIASQGDISSDRKIEAIKVLINHGADINSYDNFGLTPLHWALSTEDSVLHDYLIKNGADKSLQPYYY